MKEYRGIDTRSLPEDIRFHPGIYAKQNQKSLPALISIARTQEGKIQSVEAIFLDSTTADKANVPLKKQTIGSKKGLVVMINQAKDKDAPTLIAEGVVTGLSLANALPKTNVIVVLGKQMFSSVNTAVLSEKVIFCLDNDGKNLKTDATILASANRLRESQKVVSFMVPNDLKILKQDYNDILKHKGKEAIHMGFMRAISYDEFYKNNLLAEVNKPPFPNQKIIENTLKNKSNTPSKLTHDVSQSSQISEKQIAKFSNEISKKNTQKMKDLMPSHQEIQQGNTRRISDRFVSKPVDLDREI